MSFANRYDWKHAVMSIAALGAVVAEDLARAGQDGAPLPFHLTAGACLAAVVIFGHISGSLTDKAPAPVVVAVGPTPNSVAEIVPSTPVQT